MKISSINNSYNPQFKEWKREVYTTNNLKQTRKLKHRNDTWFYRGGFKDGSIFYYVSEKFKNIDKVNTYFWGCSNGSDVYSFLNDFFAKLGPITADKFGSIIAFDYDKVAIKKAKEGLYFVNDYEILMLEESTEQKIAENFNTVISESNEILCITPKPKLTDCVEFKLGDITKDYNKMKPENNLVFAMNLWPYLDEQKINSYAKNLYNSMGENSLLVIGEYDLIALPWHGIEPYKLFTKAGFKSTSSSFIYEK